ncbi:MAG: ATP-binding protein, partial [Caulobacteraceae bacterium]
PAMVTASAVMRGGDVLAQAGVVKDVDWAGASQLAAGKPAWTGASPSGETRWIYVARETPRPGVRVITAVDAVKLLPATGEAVIATAGGRILAARAPGGASAASNLQEAFGVSPADIQDGAAKGKLPDGQEAALAIKPAGGLVAVATGKAGSKLASPAAAFAADLFTLLGPLAIGGGLTLLLMWQSRRAQQVHRAFSDSEQRFRLAVEAARCGIWEWDLKEDRVFLSDVTGAIFGWGGGGVVAGADLMNRIAAKDRERVKQALASAAVYGAFDVSFQALIGENGGAWVDARGQGVGQSPSGYDRLIGVALDVTQERAAQSRAQAAESRLRDAIESVTEAFALWDRNGRLLMCNSNVRLFFSLEARVLKPGITRDVVLRFMRLAIKAEHPAPDGRKGVREVEMNDGRWLQISERRTGEGGVVMSAADITAVKRQEEARRRNEEELQAVVEHLERSQEQLAELARKYEAEKIKAESANKAKSEFLANMSHELRTPLNAVNGFSEIMVGELFGPLGDARYKGYAQDILNSGQHLLALINDILDMAKIEAGKMTLKFEPLQLRDVALDAIRLMQNRAESAGLLLKLEGEQLPDVEADYRALKQIMLNLLSNAIKFTPRGGQVTVGLESGPSGMLRFKITDTGIGIEADDLARLAQPFEQIESQHSKTVQGTGLGLALTKSLVEMHHGSLEMRSQPGKGTEVSVTLPLVQAKAAYAA